MCCRMINLKKINVWNNGDGIPVEMHQDEGVYVPELIFGHLITTGGRNGYGANTFSTHMIERIYRLLRLRILWG